MNPRRSILFAAVLCAQIFFPGCAGLERQDTSSSTLHRVQSSDIPPSSLAAMPSRETLTYEVRWLGIKVGVLTLSIQGVEQYQGRDVYVLQAQMRTNEFLSAFYHIADRYTSYMDARTLTTLRHEAFRNEGSYRKDAMVEFDQQQHQASFLNRIDDSRRVFEVPAGVHDMLTSFYHVLLVSLNVGDSVEYAVCHNEKNYVTKYPVTGETAIRLPKLFPGSVRTFVVEPVAYELTGQKVDKGTLKAYYTREPRRLLLLAQIRGPIFTKLTVYLTKVEQQ